MAKRRQQLRVDEFVKFYKLLTYRPELMHIIHTFDSSLDRSIGDVSSASFRLATANRANCARATETRRSLGFVEN